MTLHVSQKLAMIALAGAFGTLARYGLDGLVQKIADFDPQSLFPWGIVVVNLSGCLAFGVLASMFEGRWAAGGDLRIVLLTGFLGAFTTFSTYIFEWTAMFQDGKWLAAAGNFTIHNVGGLAAMAVGLILGRLL